MHGEPVRDYNRDGRRYGPPEYEGDCDCRRPEPDWRYERHGECCQPDDPRYDRARRDYSEDECCCPEADGPAMLVGLVDELDGMVDEVMGDLVREKIMCALEERLGEKLDRLVEAVVDSHINDLEDLLKGRKSNRPDLIEKFAEIILEDYEEEDEEGGCECSDDSSKNKDDEKEPK